ncbi:helix-turn-helix domain-containing protein [Peribacillus asahii]|uniref:helix-turn-helix domain-containing protein n=1 Tax=Peribacillus asahii TaxID=228899 RepID=UPI00382D1A09
MKEYSVKEVAKLLGKHKETVKRWIRSGKFPNSYRNSDKEGWRINEQIEFASRIKAEFDIDLYANPYDGIED